MKSGDVTPCPDTRTLERLLLGYAKGAEIEQLEKHVAACARCVATAQSLRSEDALLRALRGSDSAPAAPQQELIDAIVPLLKRLHPADEQETVPPRPGVAKDVGNRTTAPPPHPATPPLQTNARLPDQTLTVGSFGELTPSATPGVLGTLGAYRVLRQLGAGGMGVVYEAEDPQLRRQIALKVIRPELVARTDLRRRFLQEAQAVAAVEHDHIVAIFHVGEHEGLPYLAMPLLRGQTLEDRLRQANGPLPVDEVLRIGRETAEGLAAAHERGLIHRDIKPNNIFLEGARGEGRGARQEGRATTQLGDNASLAPRPSSLAPRVRILDFGLARVVQEEEKVLENTVTGTPAYMAPEQGRGEAVDARCDLFSLGCVLYRMATGKPAFRGNDLVSLLMSVALDEPAPPGQLNPQLPAALAEIIQRLLAKRPDQRPQTAAIVAAKLRDIERQRAEAARPKPSPWRWLVASAAAVLLAVGLTCGLSVGVYILLPREANAPPPKPGRVSFDFDDADGRLMVHDGEGRQYPIDVKGGHELSLSPGDYTVATVEKRHGRHLMPDRFHVNPEEIVSVPLRLVGEVRRHGLHTRSVQSVALAPVPGPLLALSGSNDGSVVGWNADRDDKPWTLGQHGAEVHTVAFSADGKWAASGSGGKAPPRRETDRSIRIWDVAERRETAILPGNPSWVTSVAFAPDGQRLLSGGVDGTVFLWDLATKTVLRRLEGHAPRRIRAVAFAPDGEHALSCGGDKVILLWDLVRGERVASLAGHTDTVSAAVFSPGGGRIASSSWDGTLRVWDVKSGTFREIKGHKGEVYGVAWLPDGRRLVSGGEDGTLRLWDAETGAELLSLRGHQGRVNAVAVSADGRYALSGGAEKQNQTVRLWELPR
jgi:serine/threonine protein kinase